MTCRCPELVQKKVGFEPGNVSSHCYSFPTGAKGENLPRFGD